MRKLFLTLLGPAMVLLFSCGNGKNKTETEKTETTSQDTQPNNPTTTNPNSGNNTGSTGSRYEQRRAKGDTLAMPYKDLQAYLPEVSGYTKDGGPRGSQMNAGGMGSFSETEQNYVNGDKHLSIKMVDYNAAYQALEGVSAVYRMGFTAEDDNKKQAAADLGVKDVFAYETIYKTEKKAELIVIVADRFFITLESNGEADENFLRNVAKSMKLTELAAK